MEESLAQLQQTLVDSEEERINREKNVLATVKSIIANMVKTKRAELESTSSDSTALENTKSLVKSEAKESEAGHVEEVLATMFSGEKAMALETFFVMMGVLIQQESEKLETTNRITSGFRHSKDNRSLSNVRSSRGTSY